MTPFTVFRTVIEFDVRFVTSSSPNLTVSFVRMRTSAGSFLAIPQRNMPRRIRTPRRGLSSRCDLVVDSLGTSSCVSWRGTLGAKVVRQIAAFTMGSALERSATSPIGSRRSRTEA